MSLRGFLSVGIEGSLEMVPMLPFLSDTSGWTAFSFCSDIGGEKPFSMSLSFEMSASSSES